VFNREIDDPKFQVSFLRAVYVVVFCCRRCSICCLLEYESSLGPSPSPSTNNNTIASIDLL